jgi:hypothetical protein
VQRDHHSQVERHHALVVGDKVPLLALLAGRLNGPGAELGHQLDALVGQQAAELAASYRLGERTVQGRE